MDAPAPIRSTALEIHIEDMPLMWKHADLDGLRLFLKEQQRLGNFKPQIGLPF